MADTDWLGIDPNSIPPGTPSFFDPPQMAQTYAIPGASPLSPDRQLAMQRAVRGQALEAETYKNRLGNLQMQNRSIQASAAALPDIARLDPNSDTYLDDLNKVVAANPMAISDPRSVAVVAQKSHAFDQRRQWEALEAAQNRELRALNHDVIKQIHGDPQLYDLYSQVAPEHGSDAALGMVRSAIRDRGLKKDLYDNGWTPKKVPIEQFLVPGRNYLDQDAVTAWIAEHGERKETPSERHRNLLDASKAAVETIKMAHDPTQLAALPEDAKNAIVAEYAKLKKELETGSRGRASDPVLDFLNSFSGGTSPSTTPKKGLGDK